jgi:hypothetical protein
MSKKRKDLESMAIAHGVPSHCIRDADASDNPKAGFVRLLLLAERALTVNGSIRIQKPFKVGNTEVFQDDCGTVTNVVNDVVSIDHDRSQNILVVKLSQVYECCAASEISNDPTQWSEDDCRVFGRQLFQTLSRGGAESVYAARDLPHALEGFNFEPQIFKNRSHAMKLVMSQLNCYGLATNSSVIPETTFQIVLKNIIAYASALHTGHPKELAEEARCRIQSPGMEMKESEVKEHECVKKVLEARKFHGFIPSILLRHLRLTFTHCTYRYIQIERELTRRTPLWKRFQRHLGC